MFSNHWLKGNQKKKKNHINSLFLGEKKRYDTIEIIHFIIKFRISFKVLSKPSKRLNDPYSLSNLIFPCPSLIILQPSKCLRILWSPQASLPAWNFLLPHLYLRVSLSFSPCLTHHLLRETLSEKPI